MVFNPAEPSGLCALGRGRAGVRAGDAAGLALAELPAGRKAGSEDRRVLVGHPLPPATFPHVTASMGLAAHCMTAGAKTQAWARWAEQGLQRVLRALHGPKSDLFPKP